MKNSFLGLMCVAGGLACAFLIGNFIEDSYEQKKQAEAQFIKKMNKENCKLVEVIAPNSAIATAQYKYHCTGKSYTLNSDLSDVLTNK